jgi:hypothetical protein
VRSKHGKDLSRHGKGFAVCWLTATTTRQHSGRQRYLCREYTKKCTAKTIAVTFRRAHGDEKDFDGTGEANGRCTFAVCLVFAVNRGCSRWVPVSGHCRAPWLCRVLFFAVFPVIAVCCKIFAVGLTYAVCRYATRGVPLSVLCRVAVAGRTAKALSHMAGTNARFYRLAPRVPFAVC